MPDAYPPSGLGETEQIALHQRVREAMRELGESGPGPLEGLAAQYEEALDHWRELSLHDPEVGCDLMIALADARRLGGDARGADAMLIEAAALARRAGRPRHLALAALAADDSPAATRMLREALTALPAEDPALRDLLVIRLVQRESG